jgi:hypothetical protein
MYANSLLQWMVVPRYSDLDAEYIDQYMTSLLDVPLPWSQTGAGAARLRQAPGPDEKIPISHLVPGNVRAFLLHAAGEQDELPRDCARAQKHSPPMAGSLDSVESAPAFH